MEEDIIVLEPETQKLLEALAKEEGVSMEKEAETLLLKLCVVGG